MNTFAEKLRYVCEVRRVAQKDIADATGLAITTINRWFAGGQQPRLDQALALARFLRVTLDYLADPEIPVEPIMERRW